MATISDAPFDALNALNEHPLAGLIEELDNTICKADGEQTEAFCTAHLHLVETHDLCVYPSEQRWVFGVGLVYGIPKALLPKDRTEPVSFDDAARIGHPAIFVELAVVKSLEQLTPRDWAFSPNYR